MNPDDTRELISDTGRPMTDIGVRRSTTGTAEPVSLSDDARETHVLCVGQTGTGKTQMMIHAAVSDAYRKRGFLFLSPGGDGIEQLISKLPEDRREDILYINPAREQVPAINPLAPYTTSEMNERHHATQRELIVSDVVALFRRQSDSWGERLGRVLTTLLRTAVQQNLDNDAGHTLVDVYDAIVDEAVLNDLVRRTTDPVLREDLTTIRDELSRRELEPVQRRLQDFIENRTVKRVVGRDDAGVDMLEAMQDERILLVDVRKGEIGATPAQIIGALVTTEVWAAAQSRGLLSTGERSPFGLYVDEIKNFAGESSNFDYITSESRKFGLCCWFATQFLHQLDTEMRRAVRNNCRTVIAFSPSKSERTSTVAGMLQGISADELARLGEYRAAMQKPDTDHAITFEALPPWEAEDEAESILNHIDCGSGTNVLTSSVGVGASAGGERHRVLLQQAKDHFEQQDGVEVTLVAQEPGVDNPDGHIRHPGGDIAHLEAECGTLAKPAKILENCRRAAEADRECVFVVEEGNSNQLANVLEDPVNREGEEAEDERGTFTYYRDDGGPFTAVEMVKQADYRIIVAGDDGLTEYANAASACPELPEGDAEELAAFCLHRDSDGRCEVLGQQCVVIAND